MCTQTVLRRLFLISIPLFNFLVSVCVSSSTSSASCPLSGVFTVFRAIPRNVSLLATLVAIDVSVGTLAQEVASLAASMASLVSRVFAVLGNVPGLATIETPFAPVPVLLDPSLGTLSGNVPSSLAVVASARRLELLLLRRALFGAVARNVPDFLAIETFFGFFGGLSLFGTVLALVALLLAVVAPVEGPFEGAVFAPVVVRPTIEAVVFLPTGAFFRNVSLSLAVVALHHFLYRKIDFGLFAN